MQSEEKNNWGSPTRVLFIPKLPPSLSNWKALKTHFSLYGDVTNVLINPQQRCCTVSFKTVSDAEYAISNGCVWKNKKFDAFFCGSSRDSLRLDPRATASRELGYSELDMIWSDEDNENFGVVESKPVMNEIKPNDKSQSASKEKNENEKSKEGEKPKLKLYSEKISNLKSPGKDRKETKKTVKEESASKKKSASTSKKRLKASSLDPNSKQGSLSLKKKFALLEERDKYIRKKFVKNSDVKLAKTVIGTCPDMCPEKERIMREYRRLVSIYEMIPGTQEMDHSLAVKAYVRSSADQEEPLPHELRPEPVLSMTMSYLISKIMPLIEDPDVNVSEWYDFCWDRLRSIRKDIIQQQLCDLETVTIIEQCARFHICCYDRLWGADPLVFDEKINTENLMNCLQSLRHMYEDLAKVNVRCPNEAEFIAYMILLNMKTGDLMATYQQFPENLLQEENVQSAVKVYLMFNNAMYSQFFKLVKRSTYLNSCLLQRYFYHIRVQALQAIARAYCPPSKGSTVPLKQMTEILKFDSSEDTAVFCEGHGLLLKDTKIRLVRNDFFIPETKIKFRNSSSLITEKRLPLIKAVIGDGKCNLRSFKDHKVHSSFTPDGRLNEMALDASDQKSKLSEMIIKTSDNLKDEEFGVDVTDMKQPMEEELAFDQQEESLPMEVDVEILPNYSGNLSMMQNKAINQSSSDDAPPRKQRSIMSSFKFDIKSINKPEIKSDSVEPAQSSFQSYFGSSADSSLAFGSKNLFSGESKQNQFNLINVFHLESDKETSQHSSMIHEDVYESDLSTKLQPKVINESYVKKHLNRIPSIGHDKSKPFSNSSSDRNASRSFLLSFPKKEEVKLAEGGDLSREEKNINGSKKESELSSANHDFNENPGKFDSNLLKDYDYHDQSPDVNCKKQNIIEENKIKGNIISEKIKRNENKLTVESDKQAMRNLKVNLKRRLKAATVRQYIRKWRQKVQKIKQFRKEFPMLFSVPVEQHAHVWGTTANINTFSTRSLLNRLKDKQHSINVVNTILDKGLKNSVPYLGHEIAENIAVSSSRHSGLQLRDFNVPLCWKLIISVPFEKENNFFIKKFNTWFIKLFYKLEHSLLGSVTEEITSQSIPCYYCVHLVSGIDFKEQKDKIVGMSGLIFIVINGFENSSDKCKRFRNLLSCDKNMKQVPVSLMKIGKNDDEQLIKLLNEKVKKRKIKKWMEEYWADFTSVLHVLKFLTADVDLSSKLRVSTLSSLLKEISECIFNGLVTAKTVSDDFSIALRNPNRVIMFYTMFITFLEKIIMKSNFKDYNVIPPEFKEYVKYLTKPGELSPVRVDFSKARRPNIVKAFSKIKLTKIEPWPPHDEDDLLNILSSYCKLVECSHVLPRVMRMIDLKDDVEFLKYLNDILWIDVIDLLVRYSLESNFIDNQRLVVICNDDELSDLYQIEFCFKLLQFVINSD